MKRPLGLTLAVAVGAGLGALLLRGCPRDWGPACQVRGQFRGPVERVVAVQSGEGFLRQAALVGSGTFQVAVPRAVPKPWIVLHGPQGVRVESAPLEPEQLAADALELPPLELWRTPLRVRCEGGRVRFDWSALPAPGPGTGFPAARRYSLLLDYPRDPSAPLADQKPGEALPERGQTSLLSFDPWMELPLAELRDDMPALLGEQPEVILELRAYDPGDRDGAQWVGARGAWTLGASALRPLD